MIRTALLAVWRLPWPPALRRRLEPLIMFPAAQRLLVPHFRVGVVAVLRDDQHRYLLLRHTYRRKHPWGLPTGYMEHGEQPDSAVRREIAEETGLTVHLGPVQCVYLSPRAALNIVFRGTVTGGMFRPSDEISEARWFTPDSIPPLMPNQHALILAWEQEPVHARSS